jgi:APA family basic amino acid/polyamine antiporter
MARAATAADLPRKLGLFDGSALLVGSVIGSGIFVVPSLIAQRLPDPRLVIGVWIFSGLLVLCGALTLAELGTMLPETGGLYVFMREAYGPFWAFLYGWTTMLVVIPGSIAALTVAFLLYLGQFVSISPWSGKALGSALLLTLAFINTRGAKLGAGVQNVFTILKVGGLLALILLAFSVAHNGIKEHFQPATTLGGSTSVLTGIGLAMISTLFAYDGWQFVALVAGELRDPARNMLRSIVIGVAIVIALYVAANVAYIAVLGQPRIAGSQRVAADAMAALIGPHGATAMTLAILCSIFGALSANVLAGPRVLFALGRDARVFARLSAVHPRHETPAAAIWALAIWSGVLTLTGGFEHLITMSQFANWIFFTMVVASAIVLRRRQPARPRPYRVAGYPFTVIVFVLVSSFFVVNTLVESPRSSLLGLGLLAAGIPFYLASRPRRI